MKKPKGSVTHVSFILDKSGSMQAVKDATISGFNEYVQTLKKDKKSKYKFTLTMFDTNVTKHGIDQDIKDVKDLTDKTYSPDGMTALYDAVMKTISDLKIEKQPILMIIMTDGQENSSVEYTQKNLTESVKELKKKGNWTFVFLGANQDSWATAQKYGFDQGNVVDFASTTRGMKNAMQVVGANTVMYAASMTMNATTGKSANTNSFFNGVKNISDK